MFAIERAIAHDRYWGFEAGGRMAAQLRALERDDLVPFINLWWGTPPRNVM